MSKPEVKKYILAFDCETGGLEPEEADILTLYLAILDSDYKLIEDLDLKLKPDGRLPMVGAEALKKNGIDLDKHLSNPDIITYPEAIVKIIALFEKYHGKIGKSNNITPLGYNVDFDIKMMNYHLIPEKTWKTLIHYVTIDPKRTVDFLKESTWFPSDIGTLTSVVDYLQIPKRNAHEAKGDTLMTVDVHKKLIEIMRNKKENSIQQDLISLLEAE